MDILALALANRFVLSPLPKNPFKVVTEMLAKFQCWLTQGRAWSFQGTPNRHPNQYPTTYSNSLTALKIKRQYNVAILHCMYKYIFAHTVKQAGLQFSKTVITGFQSRNVNTNSMKPFQIVSTSDPHKNNCPLYISAETASNICP